MQTASRRTLARMTKWGSIRLEWWEEDRKFDIAGMGPNDVA